MIESALWRYRFGQFDRLDVLLEAVEVCGTEIGI
jgi:hypothetical protein